MLKHKRLHNHYNTELFQCSAGKNHALQFEEPKCYCAPSLVSNLSRKKEPGFEWNRGCEGGDASQNEVNNTSEINLERPSSLEPRDVNASFEGQVQGQRLWGNVQITCMESMTGGKKFLSFCPRKTDRGREKVSERDILALHSREEMNIKGKIGRRSHFTRYMGVQTRERVE